MRCWGIWGQFEALEQFLTILETFVKGGALPNVVDKKSGY